MAVAPFSLTQLKGDGGETMAGEIEPPDPQIQRVSWADGNDEKPPFDRPRAGSACGKFELNAYGQGCNPLTTRCPTMSLTIMDKRENIYHFGSLAVSRLSAIDRPGLKCACMDYVRKRGTHTGADSYLYYEPMGNARPCGK